jgi:GST-like protein
MITTSIKDKISGAYMIDLYYWPTPNGHKITIFLEESGLPYRIIPVDIKLGDQFDPEYLKISPNNKMPAIIDHEPVDGGKPLSIFESGAILMYLADKAKKFIPQELRGRMHALEWLMWQMAGLGPMSGQTGHFVSQAPEKIQYAIDRYVQETARLYGVLDKQLAGKEYIIGEYSIVDMASYPWVQRYDKLLQRITDFPHIAQWLKRMEARPAVKRAFARAEEVTAK